MSHCGVSVPEGFSLPDGLLAHSFLVFDLDTGDIYAAKDPHGRYRPASIIKVLLASVAIDRLSLTDSMEVTAESSDQEGSSAGIGPGGRYTVDDLLHGLLMASGNDTAHAIAQLLGGDEEALRMVNARALDLGPLTPVWPRTPVWTAPACRPAPTTWLFFSPMPGPNPRSERSSAPRNTTFRVSKTTLGSRCGTTTECYLSTRTRSAARPVSQTMPATRMSVR
ncbi:serine-type D-Ala-D-Ala carboxypeptidase [Corynebacterium glucuronolyticum ATCC 51866]|uniref:Serine-type D-Ala-D-Ala carboxypeptidase n=1 Tax=Corynebacterium glucuronolyticum ATCC 51866 TaxID=548478 RepID=A0ABM9XQ09_9CORY|nr:serine-type D-Ala-D-Ala carboxypeptidase [Corynebacterium glucuronolyticum ATCC 51866]